MSLLRHRKREIEWFMRKRNNCSAYLDIYFKREDFLNNLWRFNSHKELTKKRVSRSRDKRFILSFVLKNVLATFKETSNLLQNILCWNLMIQRWLADFMHQVHYASGYIKEESRPNWSLNPSFTKESFRVLICSLFFVSHSCITLMHWVGLCSWVVILRNHSKHTSTSWFLGLGECLYFCYY
jgi:hypothetical protein